MSLDDITEPMVPLANYSAALDEIWHLRRALAYEARVVEAHYEGYKTFPKRRRPIAEKQVERMRLAAVGKGVEAYAGQIMVGNEYKHLTNGKGTLTRAEFEAEHPGLMG